MTISRNELIRYCRQIALPEIGISGQEKIMAAKIAVIGAGGLGAPLLSYLAAAGIGEIGIFDFGEVELSNLHRQIIYTSGDVGTLKTHAAKKRLQEINPQVKVNVHEGRLTDENIAAALSSYHYAADCTDNFQARLAINKACLELDKAYVYASVYQMEGQIAVFEPRAGACLGCLWPELEKAVEESCASTGVLGPAAGAVACMQAVEVLKLVTGAGAIRNRLIMIDMRGWTITEVKMEKRAECPICGPEASFEKAFKTAMEPEYITAKELKEAITSEKSIRILDLRQDWERQIIRIPKDEWADYNSIIKDGGGLSREGNIVLYCKTQNKSSSAYRRLKALGYKNVKVLRGGIDAWADFNGQKSY
ncbi:MAG: molybdopterin-synthase adenylyltransferase MoeB [Elusimicrobiota bacterium]